MSGFPRLWLYLSIGRGISACILRFHYGIIDRFVYKYDLLWMNECVWTCEFKLQILLFFLQLSHFLSFEWPVNVEKVPSVHALPLFRYLDN